MNKRLLFIMLVVIVLLLSSCNRYISEEEYESLQLDYDNLLSQYTSLEDEYNELYDEYLSARSDLTNTDEYIYTLSDYFENENNVTLDQAYDAFDSLHSILSNYY